MLVHHHLKKIMYSKNNSSQEKPKFYNGHRNRKSHDELKISNEDFNQKLNDQNQINILDIGFGSGESIVSQDFKQCNIFGIESYSRGIVKMNKYKNQMNIKNLFLFHGDAVEIIEKVIPKKSINIINIFFPDPWPKKKHHKRRLISHYTIGLFRQILKKNGFIHFASDHIDYSHQTKYIFENTLNKKLFFSNFRQKRPITKYEQKAIDKKRFIFDLLVEF